MKVIIEKLDGAVHPFNPSQPISERSARPCGSFRILEHSAIVNL